MTRTRFPGHLNFEGEPPNRLPTRDSVTMGESGGWKLAMRRGSDT